MFRRVSRSTLAWLFGVSLSVLLLALWGRSVVADSDTLAESLSPLSESSLVSQYLTTWMTEELVGSGVEPDRVMPTVEYILGSSAVGATLDQFVVEVVEAAASMDPNGSSVEMAALVSPAIPDISVGLAALGEPVTEPEVAEIVTTLDPLVIREPGDRPLVGHGSATVARLGTAALLAVLALTIFGYGFVTLSEDRLGALRELANRVALGGISFAIFLRLGSWVLDPRGGRAPVQATLSALAGSKWSVPLQMALVGGVLAGVFYLVRRQLRRRGILIGRRFDDTDQLEVVNVP
ncbi:MAG TPA: hypothetical protein VFO17_13490 [Acidimicrobiia bacterium]|jgi:hypothetical protein|nr:hypothetical protein [Acidimicrobiia bacterium]